MSKDIWLHPVSVGTFRMQWVDGELALCNHVPVYRPVGIPCRLVRHIARQQPYSPLPAPQTYKKLSSGSVPFIPLSELVLTLGLTLQPAWLFR